MKIGIVLALFGLVGAIVVLIIVTREQVEVGGCAYRDFGRDRLRPVACTDAKADYKVVARFPDKPQSESRRACSGYREATMSFWYGEKGKTGTVYCLDPLAD